MTFEIHLAPAPGSFGLNSGTGEIAHIVGYDSTRWTKREPPAVREWSAVRCTGVLKRALHWRSRHLVKGAMVNPELQTCLAYCFKLRTPKYRFLVRRHELISGFAST